jgi:hypothetical protein
MDLPAVARFGDLGVRTDSAICAILLLTLLDLFVSVLFPYIYPALRSVNTRCQGSDTPICQYIHSPQPDDHPSRNYPFKRVLGQRIHCGAGPHRQVWRAGLDASAEHQRDSASNHLQRPT